VFTNIIHFLWRATMPARPTIGLLRQEEEEEEEKPRVDGEYDDDGRKGILLYIVAAEHKKTIFVKQLSKHMYI